MPIPITMPIAEVADRYTIALLKRQRLPESKQFQEQVDFYRKGLNMADLTLIKYVGNLYEINALIWDAEHEIRKCLEDDLGLEEVGRRALLVRDLNMKRTLIKNKIVEHTKTGFLDCKMNYTNTDLNTRTE